MSENALKLIKKEINKEDSLEDKEINIIKFQFFKKSNILKVVLRGKDGLNNEEEDKVKKAIKFCYYACNSFHKVLHKFKFLYLIIPKFDTLSIFL